MPPHLQEVQKDIVDRIIWFRINSPLVIGNEQLDDLLADLQKEINSLRRKRNEDKNCTIPDDVRCLVVAARLVAFEDQGPDALKKLDKASEAFADRVPWTDEPEKEIPAS